MLLDWFLAPEFLACIALISAVFAGFSAFYARRMAKNDSERMRRKDLIVEVRFLPISDREGWCTVSLTIRNLEQVSARVTGASVKRKHQGILRYDEAYESGPTPLDPPQLKKVLPIQRTCRLDLWLSPAGVPVIGGKRGDTIWPALVAYQISKLSDLDIQWEWADGQKR